MEEKIIAFNKYVEQTMDLLTDSYKWCMLAKHTNDPMLKEKYKHISSKLHELYEDEHRHIESILKEA